MKIIRLFLVLIFSFVTASVFADELSAADVCPPMGKLAHTIMDNRQAGIPLSSLMATLEEAALSEMKKFVEMVVLEAYEEPLYNTEGSKNRVISEFSNRFELECYKALRK